MKQPPFPTKIDLVKGWIALSEAGHNSAEHDESFWAFSLMGDLVHDFPEEALDVVLLVLEENPSPEVIGVTAAGPIEDLLVDHGPELIDQIEREAQRNDKFNHALGGVWQSDSLPEVWERVQAVRKAAW